MNTHIEGRYYNGLSAQMTPVALVIAANGAVHTLPAQVSTQCHVRELVVEPRLSGLPMTVRFPSGGKFETTQADALEDILQRYTGKRALLHRLESHVAGVVAAVLLVCAFIGAGYVWGIPLLSDVLAPRIPRAVEQRLGEEVLQQLDDLVFEPSALSAQRQRELHALFERARQPFAELSLTQLQLRKGGFLSANALALPGGTVVLTDELATLATSDAQLLAVLLHELGHVQHRHTMQQVISQSGVAVIALLLFGDVSGLGSVLVAVPTILMQATFSRGMELEADDFAIAGLQAQQIPLAAFADLLERLDGFHTRCQQVLREARRNDTSPSPGDIEACLQQDNELTPPADANDEGNSWTSYLSTHPATQERINRLRR